MSLRRSTRRRTTIMATAAFIVVGIFVVEHSAVEAKLRCCSILPIELPCWQVQSIDASDGHAN